MLITPGEAKRPGAAMRFLYVPPTLTIHRVEMEGWIAGSEQSLASIPIDSNSLNNWDEVQLGEVIDSGGGGDIHVKW
jgi:hypothetical protein